MSSYVSLESEGLSLPRLEDLVEQFTAGYRSIYGNDINVESYSADGQRIRIEAQIISDVLEFVRQVYSSFDVNQAVGTALDRCCAINGVVRQGGSYSEVDVTLTLDTTVTLAGIESDDELPFTISDENNTLFYLKTGAVFTAGTATARFRAKDKGAVYVQPDSLNRIVTYTSGVKGVTNKQTVAVIGTDEETDAALRLRRSRSLTLHSVGFTEALETMLANTKNVSFARVYENCSHVYSDDGIPPHSIWVIVEGGSDADIAEVINKKRHVGVGMRGERAVLLQNGSLQSVIRFDRAENIFIMLKADVRLLNNAPVSEDDLKKYLLETLSLAINETLDITQIGSIIKQFNSNCVVESAGLAFYAGELWQSVLCPSAKNQRLQLESSSVFINVYV